jgi:hypothetical protein
MNLDPTKEICQRCGDEFMKQYFVVCGNCLGDYELLNRGLPTEHFNKIDAEKQNEKDNP